MLYWIDFIIITNLLRSIKRVIENNSKRLDTLKIKLELLNPKNVFDKGYSIIYKDGKIVKNTKDISINDDLNVIISDGNIDVTVKGVNKWKKRHLNNL